MTTEALPTAYHTLVWDKDSEVVEGHVVSGKLWVTIHYNAKTTELRETRGSKRWPNNYCDEFSYRDRDGASRLDYFERVEYYAAKGYYLEHKTS
jgi:hypothetical protein